MHIKTVDAFFVLVIFTFVRLLEIFPFLGITTKLFLLVISILSIELLLNSLICVIPLDRESVIFNASKIGLLINLLLLGGMTLYFIHSVANLTPQVINSTSIMFFILSFTHDIVTIVTLVLSLMVRRSKLMILLNLCTDYMARDSPFITISLDYACYLSLIFPTISLLMMFKGKSSYINYTYIYSSLIVHFCPDLLYSLLISLCVCYMKKQINHPLLVSPLLTEGHLRRILLQTKKRHFYLMNLVSNIHSCFSYDSLNSVLYCVVRLVFYAYISWKQGKTLSNDLVLVLCVQIILVPLRLLYVCYCSNSLTLQVEKATDILMGIYIERCEGMTPNTEEIVEIFLSQLFMRKGVFSPFGLFNVDLPFFCSVRNNQLNKKVGNT